jgi:hypothetical protein
VKGKEGEERIAALELAVSSSFSFSSSSLSSAYVSSLKLDRPAARNNRN